VHLAVVLQAIGHDGIDLQTVSPCGNCCAARATITAGRRGPLGASALAWPLQISGKPWAQQ
jgi:hypothetical protein